MTTQPPSQIGRYRIERELGRGTMGVVYEAVDTTLGRTVALKTFGAMAAIATHEREAFEQRFLSEARISATLDDPHVVAVYDVGRDFQTGLLFMALEFVRGETLANTLSRGPLPWIEAAQITAKVARALQGAHAHHIVHRDIKPANIMLTSQGEPKIMDFGIAKASAAQLTMAGQVFGTPAYMSPEQATGEEVDGRSDIFSLGAVLHELLTNTRAFEGPTMPVTLTRILREEPLPPSTFVGYGIPRALDAIVARAVRKSRDARYDSAAHFAADLENLIEGKTPVHATQLTPIETVDLKAIQRPTGPGGLVSPLPLAHRLGAKGRRVELDLSPVDRPPQASMRLIAAIAIGIVFGVAVVLIAQRRSTPEPQRSNANELASPVAAAGAGSGSPLTQPTALPAAAASAPPASQTPAPLSVDSAGPPVRVGVELRHPFASASLRIKVDNRIVLATSTNGMPVKSGEMVTGYDGRYGTELQITPGEHEIRLELRSGSNEFNESTRVRVNATQPPRISAAVDGNRLTLAVKE